MVLTLVWMSILLEPARMINEITIGALNTAGDVKYPTVLTYRDHVYLHDTN